MILKNKHTVLEGLLWATTPTWSFRMRDWRGYDTIDVCTIVSDEVSYTLRKEDE